MKTEIIGPTEELKKLNEKLNISTKYLFFLANMGILLLTTVHIQNVHFLPITWKPYCSNLSKIQKTNTLLRLGKPKPYNVCQKPSQAGYGRDYIPRSTMHNRKPCIK